MYIEDEELRGLYKTSATEHIQAIESALMQLEKQPQNLVGLKDLLRSAHTLKGDSRMLGVEDVETLVHQIEECLMPIEKGQASMTEELCDRLYAGLDNIKQLAHTAVTGEPNDVNMFYVLATLMGDAGAQQTRLMDIPVDELFDDATSISTDIQIDKLVESASSSLDIEEIKSDAWISPSAEESLFDTPTDLWLHEDRTSVSPAPFQLQASFLELASELFPPDSTLPSLDREAVFSDFTLIAGTSQPAEPDAVFFQDDEFTLIPSSVEIGSGIGDLESIDEDLLFSNFDNTLVPISEDLIGSLPSAAPELTEIAIPSIQVEAPASDSPLERVRQRRPATSPAAPAGSVGDYQIDTIRVEAKQLDALMGQSAEINVINQQITSRLLDLEAMLELWENSSRDAQQIQTLLQHIPSQSPLHRHLSRNCQQWEQMGASIGKFKKSIGADSSRLDLVTSALESGVKKLRLLPLATIFNLFPRMVRDLAKTQSKEINFAIEGGDLLLDKRLLEEIKDPLMHLLRNAIDHGIETPAERQQNGKLTAATLMIQVRQTGNQTTIEILDDGRGLELQRIKATAIKRGLYTQAELDLMTTDRIQSLIFESGFSTRSRVTELSGRGVGLDIVRTNVERIKGSVEVESSPDRGCTFRIVLSHTIGSSQVMMVDVREQTYAIPVEFVDRMLLVNKAEIFALGGTPTTQINGQTITVTWLADLLSLPAIAPNSPGELTRTSNSIACLLLKSGRQQLALLVDRIQDRQLVTIESPHPLLKNVPHLAGSTILGTGEVCLILNPLDLLTTATGGNPSSPRVVVPTVNPIAMDLTPTILLVEDSLVIRTQMTRILKGAGYQVTTANDGLEGWEKLQAGRFDLVVSDVEMPRWGGLELTTQIRNHSDYQNLPVILVTTLSKAADRDRGLEAGANAYLTKGDFDQQLLLDTLNRLI
ncbi:hybrid sensor histidine kinase/response regulator [Chamaesiphon sp. VAR_48_metabat_135_sub]|uniref:hybrid sensor histidine kinase/response regulator n=1 Tax=Chamaesiphon sp. VAR_48_metabat_135_sub TaxID=2964699 RepID=UPI00286AB979|nr:hybrid sensor histidine kinase/response regulator [Chamaesiphon sp. VAR_48_metabat_135_sub]